MLGSVGRIIIPSNMAFPFVCHRLSASLIQQKCNVHKQTIYKKLNIPPKPKRPVTPFLRFISEVRPTLIKEFPNLKATELVKIAAQRWSSVDSRLKDKLKQQYNDDSVIYYKEMDNYKQSLSPDQIAELKRAELLSASLKEERENKKKVKELGRPKQPLPIFMRYLESRNEERSKHVNYKDWVRTISQEWKDVNPNIKAKLEEDRKHDLTKWYKELEVWEEKMIKDGNIDLVRSRSLLPQPKTKQKK